MRFLEIVLAILGCIAIVVVATRLLPEHSEQRYDCGMAEFHPDYPAKVKEECRKLRQEIIK